MPTPTSKAGRISSPARGVANPSAPSKRYWWGDSESHEYAYYGGLEQKRVSTAPVGQFPANPFGLHDMHGNVSEWVQDCWNYGYTGAPSNGSAWTTGNCFVRVVRGGSWSDSPRNLRSASRPGGLSSHRHYGIGFRLARTL